MTRVAALLAILVGMSNAALDQLLHVDCEGNIHLMATNTVGFALDVGDTIEDIVESLQLAFNRQAKSICPELPDDAIADHYGPNFEMMLKALDPSEQFSSMPLSCADKLQDSWANSFPKFGLPNTCRYASYKSGSPCKIMFDFRETEVHDLAIDLSIKKCPNKEVPEITIWCEGVECASFGRPCETDADCGGDVDSCYAVFDDLVRDMDDSIMNGLEYFGIIDETDKAQCTVDGRSFGLRLFSEMMNHVVHMMDYTSSVENKQYSKIGRFCGIGSFTKEIPYTGPPQILRHNTAGCDMSCFDSALDEGYTCLCPGEQTAPETKADCDKVAGDWLAHGSDVPESFRKSPEKFLVLDPSKFPPDSVLNCSEVSYPSECLSARRRMFVIPREEMVGNLPKCSYNSGINKVVWNEWGKSTAGSSVFSYTGYDSLCTYTPRGDPMITKGCTTSSGTEQVTSCQFVRPSTSSKTPIEIPLANHVIQQGDVHPLFWSNCNGQYQIFHKDAIVHARGKFNLPSKMMTIVDTVMSKLIGCRQGYNPDPQSLKEYFYAWTLPFFGKLGMTNVFREKFLGLITPLGRASGLLMQNMGFFYDDAECNAKSYEEDGPTCQKCATVDSPFGGGCELRDSRQFQGMPSTCNFDKLKEGECNMELNLNDMLVDFPSSHNTGKIRVSLQECPNSYIPSARVDCVGKVCEYLKQPIQKDTCTVDADCDEGYGCQTIGYNVARNTVEKWSEDIEYQEYPAWFYMNLLRKSAGLPTDNGASKMCLPLLEEMWRRPAGATGPVPMEIWEENTLLLPERTQCPPNMQKKINDYDWCECWIGNQYQFSCDYEPGNLQIGRNVQAYTPAGGQSGSGSGPSGSGGGGSGGSNGGGGGIAPDENEGDDTQLGGAGFLVPGMATIVAGVIAVWATL